MNLVYLRFVRKLYKFDFKKLQAIRWAKMQNTLLKSKFYQDYANRNQDLKAYPVINKSIFNNKMRVLFFVVKILNLQKKSKKT